MSEEIDKLTAEQAGIIEKFGRECDIPVGHSYWKTKSVLILLTQDQHAGSQAFAFSKLMKRARTPVRYVPPFIVPRSISVPEPTPVPVVAPEGVEQQQTFDDFGFPK